ncbi:MAG: hypothetical protein DDT19_01609 [Syntrophomonadaceae bacterium]|nr:hypothetical protein [Bacillota bacterium]
MLRRRQGVVLTELLMVLLLLGILTAIAIPAMRSFGQWPLRAASQEMVARIREARQTAMATGNICYVVFFEFSARYRLELPTGREWVKLPSEVVFGGTNFPPSKLFDNRPTVYFRPTGAPNRGGHLILRDRDGRQRFIIVTPVTGRVRISETPP